ncbi:MAG: helix-turn-helix domain-containing protein [Halofilum sp. (in: g-proteobacteria)]|nr:helix-turn-helix domain-containing protein [Halofilum sp. (in: g-proteobacteria)]
MGVSNRQVGVARWCYTHLTREERYRISALRRAGHSMRAIAEMLDRDGSTISRELRRNRGVSGYWPVQAHTRGRERAVTSRSRVRIGARQWRGVADLIRRQWSPEQIARRARWEGTLRISPEWIYRFVYADKAGGGDLVRHLRCQRQRRKRYAGRRASAGARPRAANWPSTDRREADSVARRIRPRTPPGRPTRWSARVSSPARLHCSSASGTTSSALCACRRAFRRRRDEQPVRRRPDRARRPREPPAAERREHDDRRRRQGGCRPVTPTIGRTLGCRICFADPYASFRRRGTNENTNGLIRQSAAEGDRKALDDVRDPRCRGVGR